MNTWKIKDLIKTRNIIFNIGDIVVIYRRKKNGYPNSILDGVEYRVGAVPGESLVLYRDNPMQRAKIHKTYMIHKHIWRDMKLSLLLED